DPELKLPYTYQWNLAVERALGARQTITATYVGAVGRRLLRSENIRNPNSTFTAVTLVRNAATSDYHAMQLQYQRRLSRGFQALVSHTWSKSLDIASNDSSFNTPATRLDPSLDRGPSDFDVRHSFASAITYDLPQMRVSSISDAILNHWSI